MSLVFRNSSPKRFSGCALTWRSAGRWKGAPDLAGSASGSAAWLVEHLAAHLTRAIESMAGAAPQVAPLAHELSEDELETGPDKLVWWEQEFSLDPGARIWIGAAPLTWQAI